MEFFLRNMFITWLIMVSLVAIAIKIMRKYRIESNDPLFEIDETVHQEGGEYNIEIQKITDQETSLFRPTNFEQYIGQTKAKKVINAYLKASRDREEVFKHMLVYGPAGCGKTTIARIVAHQLGVGFYELITSNIEEYGIDYIIEVIRQLDGGILFCDEIHSIPMPVAERLYPIMEDFMYEGVPVKPFTLIGATTEEGEILRKLKPFYDRFKLILELEHYTPEDISKIVRQYKEKIYPNDKIDDTIYDIIGTNAKQTPRIGIKLVESTVYLNGEIKTVLENFNIIKNGYTHKDYKILKHISENEKGLGISAISSYLGTSTKNYEHSIEPVYLQQGLIDRTARGRKITTKGLKLVEELGEV